MDFDLRLLPAFVAVADERHFGRAAERLALAQPALSQQVRRLETQLGVRLFDRDGRGVELTAAGSALLPDAREALTAARRGVDLARSTAARQRPVLRVGLNPDLPPRTVRRLHAVIEDLPALDVRFVRQHQGDALDALHAGVLDVVLGWARMSYGPAVRWLRVDSAEIVAVVREGHPLAIRTSMTRDAFSRHEFVFFERQQSPDVFDWMVIAATGRRPEEMRIQQVSPLDDGVGATLRAATEGPGLTLAIAEAFEAADHPRLLPMPFAPPLAQDVLLIWSAGRETSAVRQLADAWPEAKQPVEDSESPVAR